MKATKLGLIAGAGLLALAGCKPLENPNRSNYDERDRTYFTSFGIGDVDGDDYADVVFDLDNNRALWVADDPVVLEKVKDRYMVGGVAQTMTPEVRQAATDLKNAKDNFDYLEAKAKYEIQQERLNKDK